MTIKYVDDLLGTEKLSIATASSLFTTARTQSYIHAHKCERFFHTVRKAAEHIGMLVNPSKTQLLCITPRRQSKVYSFIYVVADSKKKVHSQDSLKLLGFHFGQRPDAAAHVEALMNKFRKRV